MKKDVILNNFRIQFPAKSANEAFSRAVTSAFVAQLDPTIEELCDIKTAVSEAVTNCIVHAYDDDFPDNKRIIKIEGSFNKDHLLTIKIRDFGCGIENIKRAMEPLYTTGGEERSGMGFSIMESFTDKLFVKSVPCRGTTVILKKYIGNQNNGI